MFGGLEYLNLSFFVVLTVYVWEAMMTLYYAKRNAKGILSKVDSLPPHSLTSFPGQHYKTLCQKHEVAKSPGRVPLLRKSHFWECPLSISLMLIRQTSILVRLTWMKGFTLDYSPMYACVCVRACVCIKCICIHMGCFKWAIEEFASIVVYEWWRWCHYDALVSQTELFIILCFSDLLFHFARRI